MLGCCQVEETVTRVLLMHEATAGQVQLALAEGVASRKLLREECRQSRAECSVLERGLQHLARDVLSWKEGGGGGGGDATAPSFRHPQPPVVPTTDSVLVSLQAIGGAILRQQEGGEGEMERGRGKERHPACQP